MKGKRFEFYQNHKKLINKMTTQELTMKKVLYTFFAVIAHILFSAFLVYARTILERLYSRPLPLITNIAFQLWFLPLIIGLVYFIKHKKVEFYITLLSIEVIIIFLYFIAYLSPLVFCSTAVVEHGKAGGIKKSYEYQRNKRLVSESNQLQYLKNDLLKQFPDRKEVRDEIIHHEHFSVYLCSFNTSWKNVKIFEKRYNLSQEINEKNKNIAWSVVTKFFRGARTVKLPSEAALNVMRNAKFKVVLLLPKTEKESVNITICLKAMAN